MAHRIITVFGRIVVVESLERMPYGNERYTVR